MEIVFPKLKQWQQDVYDAVKDSYGTGKIFVTKSRRQLGKSTLCNIILITFSLQHNGSKNYMIEPTNNQCRNQYLELKKWLKDAPFVEKFNNSMREIYFTNGSIIMFKSAELRDRLRGFTCTGITIIDEAAFIRDDVIDSVLPWCDVHSCPILLVSTPLFCEGYFYDWFTHPDNQYSFSFDWADSKYDLTEFLSAEKLEQYRKKLSELKFKSEYLGQFITEGSFVFHNIDKCTLRDKKLLKDPVVCSIDWGTGAGGEDGDYTWLTFMDEDYNVTDIIYFNDLAPTEQIRKISSEINKRGSLKSVLVEKNSIGSVYGDMLYEKLKRKEIFDFFITNNDSKRRIIEKTADLFANEKIKIPNDNELLKQLLHYAVQKLKTGYTYNGEGAHDDGVMSLAIAVEALTVNMTNIEDDIRF